MKEQIYTIPVSEAFETRNGKCPLCLLREKWEQNELDLILGASMMEPDIRIQTNEKGFCNNHLHKMYEKGNRLPLALTLESHLAEVEKGLKTGGFFSRDIAAKSVKYLDALEHSCYLCDRINATLERMVETTALLYGREPEFRKLFNEQRMFCPPHFRALLVKGREILDKKRYEDFVRDAFAVVSGYAKELGGDVSWFCKKFDYRYEKEDWKNSKDAVERALDFLNGTV